MTPSGLRRKYRVRVTTRYPELSGAGRAANGAHVGEYGAKRASYSQSRRSRGWGVFAGQTGLVSVITVIITVHRFRDLLIQMGEHTRADQRKRGNQLLSILWPIVAYATAVTGMLPLTILAALVWYLEPRCWL